MLDLILQLSEKKNIIKEHLVKLKAEGRFKRINSDRSGYMEIFFHEK